MCYNFIIYIYIIIYNIAAHIITCRFESMLLLKYLNPYRNWTFQRFAKAAEKKRRNRTNEKSDNRQDSNQGPRLF